MATLAELRKKAKDMGIAASVIRSATSASELSSIIADHSDDGASKKKGKGKTVAKKKVAAKKKSAVKAVAKKKSSGNSNKSASSTKSPAKSTKKKGTAKRTSTATRGTDGPSGRHLLDDVDFSATDGWNARAGSAPDRIVKALKRFRGNRDKVFDFLVGDVWDFVGKKMADGSKRTKADAEAMLRYRISRTAWDFAMRTGQHEKSENRAEYGTAGTGAGTFKRKKAQKAAPARQSASKSKGKGKSTPRKQTAKKAGRKPAGRKPAKRK